MRRKKLIQKNISWNRAGGKLKTKIKEMIAVNRMSKQQLQNSETLENDESKFQFQTKKIDKIMLILYSLTSMVAAV